MKVLYSDQEIEIADIRKYPYSVFLAGPTPRDDDTQSWRPEAISIFEEEGYQGLIWVPEYSPEKNNRQMDYLTQVEWEQKGLSVARDVLFWVPRDLEKMPALTTNVEFGMCLVKRPKTCHYGRPDNADKCRYLDWLYTEETGKKAHNDLRELIMDIV